MDAMAAQRVGNQLRLAHAAGIERQVDGAFARAGIHPTGGRRSQRTQPQRHRGGGLAQHRQAGFHRRRTQISGARERK